MNFNINISIINTMTKTMTNTTNKSIAKNVYKLPLNIHELLFKFIDDNKYKPDNQIYFKDYIDIFPLEIYELIFKFIDYDKYKQDHQIYFKDYIAPYIDKTFKKVNHNCYTCYIYQSNGSIYTKCFIHYIRDYDSIIPNYYSLHSLPNKNKDFGKLFLAINNIDYFLHIIEGATEFKNHKLTAINAEIYKRNFILKRLNN